MAQAPTTKTSSSQNATLPRGPASTTILPYLQATLHHLSLAGTVSIYHPPSSTSPSTTYAPLSRTKPNTLLLYPGSFNPSHVGHLATIQYLYRHRHTLHITTLFLYCDPTSTIHSKKKKFGKVILPLNLRNEIFYNTPELTPLIKENWLKILIGTITSHILFLRHLTDSISSSGFDIKLVGFLGGDKLSRDSAPHEKPGELGMWGPLDEFLILNARRPVDFYTPVQLPSPGSISKNSPENLPGCTKWKRGVSDSDGGGVEEEVGVEWLCNALTLPNEPIIRFRASERSASNGVSSTAIRKIMCEAPDEMLYEELAPHVLGVDMLVEWLKRYRGEVKWAQNEIMGESVVELEG